MQSDEAICNGYYKNNVITRSVSDVVIYNNQKPDKEIASLRYHFARNDGGEVKDSEIASHSLAMTDGKVNDNDSRQWQAVG